MASRYEVVIEASGEVRDADGNLIETIPVKQTLILTEDQIRDLSEQGE